MMKRIFMGLTVLLLVAIPVFAAGGGGDTDISWIFGLIAGGIVFYSYRASVLKDYGSEGQEKPYPFKEKAVLKLTENRDVFVRQYQTAFPKAQNNHHGGHGGHGGRGI